MLWIAIVAWHAAQSPPQPATPAPPVPHTAWSCTRQTLLSGELCAFDGHGGPAAPDGPRQSARDAASLLREACTEATRVGSSAEPTALAACLRVEPALAAACDHAETPLRDAAGRFNPGHARCYAALRGALEEAQQLIADAHSCCSCAVTKCAQRSGACHARIAQHRALEGTCAQSCAAACANVSARAALAPSPKANSSPGSKP
jgi:hypothetical protein